MIFGIPRGVQFAADRRQLSRPESGEVAEPTVLEPFKATSQLTLTDQSEFKRERFEVAEATAPENLVRLDSYKSRRDNDGDDGPGRRGLTLFDNLLAEEKQLGSFVKACDRRSSASRKRGRHDSAPRKIRQLPTRQHQAPG